MKAIVTVVGKDRVGIIAGVCTALADFIKNRRICVKQIFVSALSTGCKQRMAQCIRCYDEILSLQDIHIIEITQPCICFPA